MTKKLNDREKFTTCAVITNQEADILRHASRTGRYVSNEPLCINLGERGLLYDHGPQRLAGGDHYLVMTGAGRVALNEWQSSQPKPPKPKRRASSAFQAWRAYLDATYNRMAFPQFLKEVWPRRADWMFR